MLGFLNNTTATVQRRSSSSKNSYNEPNYTETPIYSNIGVRYDDYGGKTQFNDQGERVVSTRKIHVDVVYTIHEEDVITLAFDSIARRVVKVVPEFGPVGVIFSWECTLLDP